MGILSSLISLGVVVGLGYVTITYIIPKLGGGELASPSSDETVISDIADIVNPPSTTEEKKSSKSGASGKVKGGRKGGGGKGGKSKSGAEESGSKKSSKKAKEEFIYAYFNFGDEVNDGYI